MAETVRLKTKQPDRAEGILLRDPENHITVWVKTWGQLVNDGKARLKFFQEKLQYATSKESGLEYLRKTHEKYLPAAVKQKA